jgi:chemotaxis protein methyltransferase CheR
MTEILDDYHFNRLLRMVYNYMKLDCSHYKTSYLKRRVAVRMRATKTSSYKEYENLLAKNNEEYHNLLDRLTINVSNFFRDVSVFEGIKKLILPGLANKRHIRIWSAGCANGEEPYSLAMLFDRAFPGRRHWEITATDIDPSCLSRAKEGRYRTQALVEMPVEFKTRYLTHDGELWSIKDELKKRIKFKQLDLTRPLPNEHYDLILCRNVMIYFLPQLQTRLFEEFRQMLVPSGYLVLGKTETMLGEWRKKFIALNGPERIFQVTPDQIPA